jgi:hypothetical protein
MVYGPLRIVSKYKDNVRGRIRYGTPLQVGCRRPSPEYPHKRSRACGSVFFYPADLPPSAKKKAAVKIFYSHPMRRGTFIQHALKSGQNESYPLLYASP